MTLKISIDSQIRLVLVGELLVITCTNMSYPYWPLILKQYLPEYSAFQLALWSIIIYVAPFIAAAFAIPIWGYVGRAVGYKKMIIRCTVVLAIVQVLLFFSDRIIEFFVLRLAQGVFAGYTPSAQAFLVSKKPDGEHSFLIGKTQSMIAIGTILGPVLGGFISHYSDYHSIFLTCSVAFLLITILMFFFLSETPLLKDGKKKSKFKLKDSLPLLTPFNSYCYLLILLTKALRMMSSSFFALYVIDCLNGNNIQTGILYAAMALMIFLVAPVWGKMEDRNSKNIQYLITGLVIALFSGAAAQVVYGIAHNFALAMLASTLWGGAIGVTNTLPLSLLTSHQQASMKGIALGVGVSMSKLGNVLGITLGGFLYYMLGFQTAFFSIAIGYLLLAFMFWWRGTAIISNN